MLFVNVGEDAVMHLIIRVKIWEHSPIFSKSQTKKSYDYCMYCFVLILRLCTAFSPELNCSINSEICLLENPSTENKNNPLNAAFLQAHIVLHL